MRNEKCEMRDAKREMRDGPWEMGDERCEIGDATHNPHQGELRRISFQSSRDNDAPPVTRRDGATVLAGATVRRCDGAARATPL